nr:DNA-binding protein [Escherichia coli]
MFYSANELAGLPGLPGTVQGVRWTLNRITETHPEWKRKREGTKAFEYHIDCLPAEAQKVLRKRLTHQVLEDTQLPAVVEQKAVKNVAVRDELEVMVKCPELALREVQALTDKQKAIADARIRHHPVPLAVRYVHTFQLAGCGAESGFLCAYRVGAREFVKNPFVTEAST